MKQGLKPSQIETLLFIVLLHLPPSTAHAKLRCESLFKPSLTQSISQRLQILNPSRYFNKSPNLTLSALHIDALNELSAKPEWKRPYGMGRDENSPLFIFMWQNLKPEMREAISIVLDNAPTDQKKFRNYLDEIYKANEISHPSGHTFLDSVISSWIDVVKFKKPNFSFSEWIKNIEQNFENRIRTGELNRQNIQMQFDKAKRFNEVQEEWHSRYGVFALEEKASEGNRRIIKLKSGHELDAVVSSDGKSIKLKVPRNLVGRAAWNPIYTEVLQDKISKGVKPPEIYDGFLATNGTFYLTDGNHRFILDQRQEVWIRLSYPAKTASMSISFDAFGFSQPKVETLVEFFDGKKTLEDLIGGANAARIQYK